MPLARLRSHPLFQHPFEGLRAAVEVFLLDTLLSHLFLWMRWDGRTELTMLLWLKTAGLYLLLGLALELLLLQMKGIVETQGVRHPYTAMVIRDTRGMVRVFLLTVLLTVLISPRLPLEPGSRVWMPVSLFAAMMLTLLRRATFQYPLAARWEPGMEAGLLLFLLLGTRVNTQLLGGSPLLPANVKLNAGLLGACLVIGWWGTGALSQGKIPNLLQGFSTQDGRLKRLALLNALSLLLAVQVVPGLSLVLEGDKPQTARRMSTDPNVLLLVVDTLRADRLGAYGYEDARTPHIDALARASRLFRHHQTSSPWTYPSFGTILTGFSPGVHLGGVLHKPGGPQRHALLGVQPLRQDLPTLASLLQQEGYRTGLIGTNPCLDRTLGMGKGFTTELLALRTGMYYTVLGSALEGFGYRPLDPPETTQDATQMVDHFFSFIDAEKPGLLETSERLVAGTSAAATAEPSQRRPFFLLAHMMDPHWPYHPPERFLPKGVSTEPGEFETRGQNLELSRWSELYDAEVQYVDEQVGRLVEGLKTRGLWDNTLVILTSDHGEAFGEHGSWHDPTDQPDEPDPYYSRASLHGHNLYQPLLQVPFLLHIPGGASGVYEGVTGAVDVLPTVLDALKLPVPEGLEGRSLLSVPLNTPPAVASSLEEWEKAQGTLVSPPGLQAASPSDAQAGSQPLGATGPNPSFLCPPIPRLDDAGAALVEPPALSHSLLLGDEKYAWVESSLKLIHKPTWPEMERFELYNLVRDAGETVNLAPYCPEVVKALEARLTARLTTNQSRKGAYTPPTVDPASLAKLRALGYAQ